MTQLTLNLIRSVWYWCKTKCYQGSYLKYLWDLCFTITPPGLAQMHWVSVLTPTYLRYSPCWHAFRIWSLFCNWSMVIPYYLCICKMSNSIFFCKPFSNFNCQIVLRDHRFANCFTRSFTPQKPGLVSDWLTVSCYWALIDLIPTVEKVNSNLFDIVADLYAEEVLSLCSLLTAYSLVIAFQWLVKVLACSWLVWAVTLTKVLKFWVGCAFGNVCLLSWVWLQAKVFWS